MNGVVASKNPSADPEWEFKGRMPDYAQVSKM